ncbi:hypothetical protein D0869_06477 [Hortaea werneckii]|uniref:Uncharacterized protein n=1 Tax=Hortaea werneckii TaxID=91943 RepID=A0A3M6WUK2_HORWE|nr:hypothetical protein D0869_06477 [Hortaea werneckii]RMY02706.1 hypothetical protein D0868_07844 [Hortaea werneckii]
MFLLQPLCQRRHNQKPRSGGPEAEQSSPPAQDCQVLRPELPMPEAENVCISADPNSSTSRCDIGSCQSSPFSTTVTAKMRPTLARMAGHDSVHMDPALVKYATWLSVAYVLAIPGALMYTAYKIDGKWDLRGKRRGDIISEF